MSRFEVLFFLLFVENVGVEEVDVFRMATTQGFGKAKKKNEMRVSQFPPQPSTAMLNNEWWVRSCSSESFANEPNEQSKCKSRR